MIFLELPVYNLDRLQFFVYLSLLMKLQKIWIKHLACIQHNHFPGNNLSVPFYSPLLMFTALVDSRFLDLSKPF